VVAALERHVEPDRGGLSGTMMDEQDQEYQPKLADYVATLRRRWPSAAVAFVVVVAIGAGVALLWPPVYRSMSTVLIEQQAIPEDLVRSTISSFADQRIQLIKQRVMTTVKLLEIIREHGLYADDFDSKPREVIIDRMRRDIKVATISADVVDPRSGQPMAATIAFTVAYDNRSPVLAARVANQLTSLFLQGNSETRREQAAEASTFLTEETKRLSDEMQTLEGRLAAFKEKNVEKLPELAQFNLQLANRTEDELAQVRRDRSAIQERRVLLRAQLAQLHPDRDTLAANGEAMLPPAERLRGLESYLSSIRGIYTADHPDVVRTEKSIAALRKQLGIEDDRAADDIERELADLRVERTALLDRYQPLHPDVVRLDRRIEAAEERLRTATATATPAAEARAPDNPAYLSVQSQIDIDEVELASLEQKERALKTKLADIERRIAETPGVERDFYAIARDLDNARRQHQEVSAKQMSAVVSQNLEMDSKGEHFTLIEPPLVPERPVAPNRWLIVALSVVLGLGASVGLIALREALDGSVRGARELEHLVGASPLGIIPLILTADERRAKGRQRVQLAAATTVAFVALVVLAHLFVAPLDVLWFAALRRFGV